MKTALDNALYYAARKSEQNMAAALDACTADFVLHSPPFGSTLCGTEENFVGMAQFFALFLDYTVHAEHTAEGPGCLIMAGKVSMTPHLAYLGLPGVGRRATVEFTATFETRGERLAREVFLLDIVELCNQSGLSLAALLDVLNRRHDLAA